MSSLGSERPASVRVRGERRSLTGHRRTGRPRFLRAVAGLVPAIPALCGCDPPPPRDILLGPAVPEPFAVAGTNVLDSCLPRGEDLVLRFTAPVDPASVLPRSVTVVSAGTRGGRRRLGGSAVVLRGDRVIVPAEALAALGAPEAEVRVEGGPSPSALRSADGRPLPGRWALQVRFGEPDAADLEGPSLVATRPSDGSEAAPGASIEIRFDEPVYGRDDPVTLLADGAEVPATVRTTSDARRLLVCPGRPIRPGASVTVRLHRSLTDDAGNPLNPASPRTFSFRVRDTRVHELEEDFSSDDQRDRDATSCGWGDPAAPGVLVARRGPTALVVPEFEPTTDLGDREEIRFQMLLRGDDVEGGLACGLRLRFTTATGLSPVRGARIEAGATGAESLLPSFQDNRDAAALDVVAATGPDPEWEALPSGGADVTVPFERPLVLDRGSAVLLDVVLSVEPGARLGACPDLDGRSLVRGGSRERLQPSAALLVSGPVPTARSLWYDAGTDGARWLGAVLDLDAQADGSGVRAEFQAAPADGHGAPDTSLASPWEPDLALVPPWRFVRFRLRFRAADEGHWPRIDRVVLPFEPVR